MPVLIKDTIKKKGFLFFLLSQGISGLGDTFQLVAATALIVKVTGSGMAAGIGLVYNIMASIIISPIAGLIGDRVDTKRMLVLVDILRGIVVVLFINNTNIVCIYVLVVILSGLDVLYNPSRRKIISILLNKNELIVGNSLLSGITGVAYLCGPVIAGVLVGIIGVNTAFTINSLSFFISAILISFINMRVRIKIQLRKNITHVSIIHSFKSCLSYFSNSKPIKRLIILGTIVCFGSTSINIAFYPFAFDFLQVTDRGWGVMLSVFYGTNLIAMPIALKLGRKGESLGTFYLFIPILVVSFMWLGYGYSNRLSMVLILQFLEGCMMSVFYILLSSQIQFFTHKDFMARIFGINDIINSLGKLMAVVLTYISIKYMALQNIFVINASLLMFFVLFQIASSLKLRAKLNKEL